MAGQSRWQPVVVQPVVVIFIVVSVKCEQWHKSSANSKESLSETKHLVYNSRTHI